MKLCATCQGSGSKFWMKDGKPHWEPSSSCLGKQVTDTFTDETDDVELERWLEEYERSGGVRF